MTRETYNMLEDAVQRSLQEIDFSEQKGGNSVQRAETLVNLLITADKNEDDYHDKKERREIEKSKNETSAQIEREKSKLTWGRIGFEMAKLVVPLGISVYISDKWQRRMMKFEETGRFTSSISREFHLPKLFK